MMKQLYDKPKNPTDPTHLAADQKGSQNYHLFVMPQPALSCDVRVCLLSGVKLYQDFSEMMNKIVGARLNQI